MGPADTATRRRSVRWRNIALSLVVLATLSLIALATLPVGLFRAQLERSFSARYGAPVRIGALDRDSWFSFTPVVSVRDVTIAQPAWVGQGTFLSVRRASVRVPVFAALTGRFRPDRVAIDGLRVALVRRADKRSNWDPRDPADDRRGSAGGSRLQLSDLTISDGRFSLDDRRRGLVLSGPIMVGANGMVVRGQGQFLGTPATLDFRGGRITGVDPQAAYPFAVDLISPALRLHADGMMDGALNTRKFSATLRAQAPTLKNLDRVIEAGLFGTQPIDLAARIRHVDRDWFVDALTGRVGRSRLTASASIVKRDDRTVIDGKVHAGQFDFGDLSDDQGVAKGAALEARIGPRILPTTRIDLSKLGKLDGQIAFVVDRLLARKSSVFRSLRATLSLDHRVVTVSNVVATLADGRMTGNVRIDHRAGDPKLAVDMRFDGASLDAIVGKPDIITGAVRGRIVLAGQGSTVREALSRGSGKVAMVATQGSVKTIVADVLGQDLGRAIGHVIHQDSDRVPLRCMVADFRGQGGVFVARPIAIDTGNSVGRGTGRVIVDGERLALTLAGATRNGSALKIADPIRITGTMSDPHITVAGMGGGAKPSTGAVLKVVTRSIGAALGLGHKQPKMAPLPDPLDCGPLIAAALR